MDLVDLNLEKRSLVSFTQKKNLRASIAWRSSKQCKIVLGCIQKFMVKVRDTTCSKGAAIDSFPVEIMDEEADDEPNTAGGDSEVSTEANQGSISSISSASS